MSTPRTFPIPEATLARLLAQLQPERGFYWTDAEQEQARRAAQEEREALAAELRALRRQTV